MKYLIIGNGVAGTTAAKNIRKIDPDGEITIITDEKTPFYSRIRLIDYLAGEATEKDIIIHKEDWYEKNNIKLILGSIIFEINSKKKEVTTRNGERHGYDRLLMATGGVSFIPGIDGYDKKGVFALRNIQDAREIINYADEKKKVVLVGGGVLGLEAGNSLRKRGLEVSVIEFSPRLLPRQMDPEGAGVLKEQMEGMGFSFYLGAKTKEISGGESAEGVLLEDGTAIEGDVIIISAGIRPRVELAIKLRLALNKGLVINDKMETGMRDIYAAGDLIEHRERFYGIWPAAQKQGEIAGINMAGGEAVYQGTIMSNVLKVAGVDLAAAGNIDADNKLDSIIARDRKNYVYRKLVIENNILAGCILFGDISGYKKILTAINEKRDVSSIRDNLDKWDINSL